MSLEWRNENNAINDEIDEPLKRSQNVVMWVLITSVIYILIYIFIFIPLSVDIPINTNGSENLGYFDKFLYVFQSNDGKLGVNGLGDALAGLFAPLAFLWLAAAVYVQSNQLRSQQLELRAQRDEMDETQILMQRQIEATQAQTLILQAQYNDLKRKDADNLIKANLKKIDNWIFHLGHLDINIKYYELRGEKPKVLSNEEFSELDVIEQSKYTRLLRKYEKYPKNSTHVWQFSIAGNAKELNVDDLDVKLNRLIIRLDCAKKRLVELDELLIEKAQFQIKYYEEILALLSKIKEVLVDASPEFQVYLDSCNLPVLTKQISTIIKLLENLKIPKK